MLSFCNARYGGYPPYLLSLPLLFNSSLTIDFPVILQSPITNTTLLLPPKFKDNGMVESERIIGENTTKETRFYISSLDEDAHQFERAVRSHWGIENSVHWILDIAFREDESRLRKKNEAAHFAILRHIALNLLKHEKTCS